MSKSSFSIWEKLGSNFEFLHLPRCGGRGTPTLSLSRIPNVYSSHFIFPSSSFLRNTIIWILQRGEGEEWLDSPSLSLSLKLFKWTRIFVCERGCGKKSGGGDATKADFQIVHEEHFLLLSDRRRPFFLWLHPQWGNRVRNIQFYGTSIEV